MTEVAQARPWDPAVWAQIRPQQRLAPNFTLIFCPGEGARLRVNPSISLTIRAGSSTLWGELRDRKKSLHGRSPCGPAQHSQGRASSHHSWLSHAPVPALKAPRADTGVRKQRASSQASSQASEGPPQQWPTGQVQRMGGFTGRCLGCRDLHPTLVSFPTTRREQIGRQHSVSREVDPLAGKPEA